MLPVLLVISALVVLTRRSAVKVSSVPARQQCVPAALLVSSLIRQGLLSVCRVHLAHISVDLVHPRVLSVLLARLAKEALT